MTLHENLKKEIPVAMKARDALRLSVLRGIVTSCTNELVSKKRKPDEVLEDEDTIAVISREAKRRKEAILQFKAGGREDLADKESAELEIINAYLPQLLGEDEIRKVALQKKEELSMNDPAKKGILVGAVMKELKGKAEGNTVKDVVDSLF